MKKIKIRKNTLGGISFVLATGSYYGIIQKVYGLNFSFFKDIAIAFGMFLLIYGIVFLAVTILRMEIEE